MSDQIRALRNMLVGGALFLGSVYMLLYTGHLKKVAADWEMISHEKHTQEDENYAAKNWTAVQTFERDHPILWEIAPLTPPYGWNNQPIWFTWLFFQVNWRFLAYLVLLGASAGMAMSGFELQKLIDQLNHEDRLEKMRVKRRGGMTAPSSAATLIEIRNEIQVQASETGKWYSINGAIVGGTISSILAPLILKALHLG